VVETPFPADYHWRVTVSRNEWAQFVAWSALGIDYENFKNEVARHPHPEGFVHALHGVWAEMVRVQDRHHPRSLPFSQPFSQPKGSSATVDDWLVTPWSALEVGMTVRAKDKPELGIGRVEDVDVDGKTVRVAFLLNETDEDGNVTEDEVVFEMDSDQLDEVPWDDDFNIDPDVANEIAETIYHPVSGRPDPETFESLDEYRWDGSWPEPVPSGILKGR
jgi:hypothetical protein